MFKFDLDSESNDIIKLFFSCDDFESIKNMQISDILILKSNKKRSKHI